MKLIYPVLFSFLLLSVFGYDCFSQCTATTAFGTINAAALPGTVSCTYAGEYNTINNVVNGASYTATSTIGTDFITIRQGTPGGAVVASGTTPLNWTATAAGDFYLHVHTNSGCGTQSACRNTTLSIPAVPMTYVSSTTTQSVTSAVGIGANNQQVIGIQVVTAGATSPLTVTQFTVNASGTTAIADINLSTAKIYYTGTSATFATTTLFGGTIPTIANFNVNGSQALATGTNYFWLTYDINPSATAGNIVDAQCTSLTIGGAQTPSVTAPAGSRTITAILAPGGVLTGLETWVRADIGVTGSSPVTAWSNQNLSGTATLLNGSPNLNTVATTYNYNPYIDFTAPVGSLDGGVAANRQCLLLSGYSGIAGIDYRSVFFAFQLNDLTRIHTHCATVQGVTFSSPANGTWHGDANGATASILLEAYDIVDFGTGAAANTWQRNGVNVLSNSNHSSTKHILSAVSQTGGPTTLNAFLGGQSDQIPASSFSGHVRDWRGPASEVIGYTTAVSALERQRINSYLAIKYGITLTANYLSTSGSTIFTTAAPYNNNIIGIGRDDIEALTQKQSHNDDDIVRLYVNSLVGSNAANTGTFSSNISYVVTGATTGAMCATAAAIAEMPSTCGLYSRIEREWKVTRTNMAQNFNMDFRLAACAVPGSVNVADLRLLVDDDGNFANGGTVCYSNATNPGLFTYSNPTITVTGITSTMIPNNATRFITIGSVQVITPLPVELMGFDAECIDEKVTLNWSVASQVNNAFYTIDRSENMIDFETIATIDGQGTTSVPMNYSFEDATANRSSYYYRLQQTDFDGTKEVLGALSVNCSYDLDFVAYPNPFTEELKLSAKYSGSVTLFDLSGRQISETRVNAGENSFDVSKLAVGSYVLKYQSDNGTMIVTKMIKR